jgi:hypothetical protein
MAPLPTFESSILPLQMEDEKIDRKCYWMPGSWIFEEDWQGAPESAQNYSNEVSLNNIDLSDGFSEEDTEETQQTTLASYGEKGKEAVSQDTVTSPPRADEIDRWQHHIAFEQFGRDLNVAAAALFPKRTKSRYKNVFVLMLKWDDEDPNLSVSLEIQRLYNVFKGVYHFETEVWNIPDEDCHVEVNQKVLDFSRIGGNSKDDLKIVYYAGHGKLMKNRLLLWTRYEPLSKHLTYNSLNTYMCHCIVGEIKGSVNARQSNGVVFKTY